MVYLIYVGFCRIDTDSSTNAKQMTYIYDTYLLNDLSMFLFHQYHMVGYCFLYICIYI